jgi:FMN-dependent NADH-azoreductase
MARLLCIQASPRVGRSHAIAVTNAFIEAYQGANPGDEVETLNVFEADLPPFDGLAVQAKYTILHGKDHTEEERGAWRAVEAVIEQFTAADKYALAVPMWNFGIPYRLKQYLDILVQPGYTFSYDPETGFSGLVTGKPVFIAYASGGEYGEGSETAAFDLQRPYVELILGFMGLTDIRSVTVAPTLLAGPEAAAAAREAAVKTARELAAGF